MLLTKTREEVFLRRLFLSFLFTLATGLGAQIRIPLPFTPVPITMQTFFVLASGVTLGAFWGSFSQILYILMGAFGFPYFSGWSAGVKTLIGPTGGYIIGFAIASYISGVLTKNKLSLKRIYLAMLLGEIVILFLGALWLSISLSLSLSQAFIKGVLPFLPGDSLKILVGGLFSLYLCRWSRVET